MNLNNKSQVLVLGAGLSGIAATKFLLSRDIAVLLFDDKKKPELKLLDEALLNNGNLTVHAGLGPLVIDNSFQFVVCSPGVSPSHPLIKQARDKKLPIINEIDLAYNFLEPVQIIGITGTNGKSTTTVMLESIFKAAGFETIACGNLGMPLCHLLLSKHKYEVIVLELSSFQLELLNDLRLDGAIITNITPDHLDRYRTLTSYKNTKLRIASLLKPNASLVLPSNLMKDVNKYNCNKIAFDIDDYAKHFGDLEINGQHNQENAIAAAMLAKSLGIENSFINKGILSYVPLPHRCEVIANKGGVLYVNDSKGTTVVSVAKALSMWPRPTHLLLGGVDKGEDFVLLEEGNFPHIKGYYVFGQAKTKILKDLGSNKAQGFFDLHEAFLFAAKVAKAGDLILLSPGCASYDQFDNFEQRGVRFRELVYACQ
jgi:UDP-N-acetylmuramoylalanine--D-glutamate ligase